MRRSDVLNTVAASSLFISAIAGFLALDTYFIAEGAERAAQAHPQYVEQEDFWRGVSHDVATIAIASLATGLAVAGAAASAGRSEKKPDLGTAQR